MTIEVGFWLGSSYNNIDRPYCQDRPIIRIVLSLGSSYNDKVLESTSLDNKVLESNNKVEFL